MATRKILVVDDNMDAADMTAELLRVFGLDVDVAYGGNEALAAARARAPDVIFLDLGMPLVDGYDVAKALRAEVMFNSVKLVALTAWGDESSRERAKAAGFDLHLMKPTHISALVDIAA